MRIHWGAGALGAVAVVMAFAPAAAACTSSEQTTDLGVASVTQYENDCGEDWGNYGYAYGQKGVRVAGGGASADAGTWRYSSWGQWGDYGYDYVDRGVFLRAGAGVALVDGGLGHTNYQYYGPGYAQCYGQAYGWVFAYPAAGYYLDEYAPCTWLLSQLPVEV